MTCTVKQPSTPARQNPTVPMMMLAMIHSTPLILPVGSRNGADAETT